MAGLLGDIFSAGNVARRKLTDLLGNPLLSAQQFVGNLNDRARVLNEMTSAAAQEGVNYGPASRKLAGLLAEAYNPIGMTVYHGSPAKFSRFDPKKIGSGEGAQAYGYGHYVAEAPETAKQYKEMLKSKAFSKIVQRDRNVYDVIAPDGTVVSQGTVLGKAHKAKDAYDANVGSVYEIDLPDEQIAKMLDWDKPLKDQPEALKAIRNQIQDAEIERSFDANVKSGISGANAMQNYVWGKTPADKSEALRQAGIPGIRYLDQGSRGAGEGTSNFVVFPGGEDLLTILKRNGGLLGPYPQEQALRLAQKNAAKPISEGGLGLPPDNTPMDRARAMGFESGWAHGSPRSDITELRSSRIGAQGPGVYATNYLPEASTYSQTGEGATVYPLMVRRSEALNTKFNNPYDELGVNEDDALLSELFGRGKSAIVTTQEKTPDWLLRAGAPDMPERQHFVSVRPENFRSRFAAFDPARMREADILAGVLPLSLLADEEQRKKADAYFRSLLGQ